MTYITGALVGLLGLIVVTYGTVTGKLIREHARERQLLLNQLLNLAGKPWLPAPATPEPEPDRAPEMDRYITVPEQWPDQ